MGKKRTFYLDPDERKWTMEDLGLSWDDLIQPSDESVKWPAEGPVEEQKSFEGAFFAKNRKIIDWFELPDHCPECLERLSYNDEFDSIYCVPCDEWRDIACEDPTCDYCAERPEKPSDCK